MGNKYSMLEEEKYFFDLTGYLIVRHALTSEEVSECNKTIDRYVDKIQSRSIENGGLAGRSEMLHGQSGRLELTGMLGWPLDDRSHGGYRRPSSAWCRRTIQPISNQFGIISRMEGYIVGG